MARRLHAQTRPVGRSDFQDCFQTLASAVAVESTVATLTGTTMRTMTATPGAGTGQLSGSSISEIS